MHLISSLRFIARSTAVVAVASVLPTVVVAQTVYPSFQPPRTVDREYTVGVADGDHRTSLVFQWREGWSPVSQLGFDVGLSDPEGRDVELIIGGTYAHQLARTSDELPLDLLLTVGANALVGNGTLLEIPVGLSAGHRFPLGGALAITPYVHPRVSLQYFSGRGENGSSDTDLGVAFDVGGDFEVSSRLSLRASFVFGDNNRDAIGFGVSWRPLGVRR